LCDNYVQVRYHFLKAFLEQTMKGRFWTVPNQITLLRLGILPFFL